MLGLLLGLAVIALVTITLVIVRDYFNKKKKEILLAKTGKLIKEYLGAGKYRVIGGVFDKNKNLLDAQSWEGELDDELKAEFGKKNKITYEMTA